MTNTYTRGLAEYIASSTFEILPQATAARLSTAAQDDMIALCQRLETVEDATILVAMMEPGSHGLS